MRLPTLSRSALLFKHHKDHLFIGRTPVGRWLRCSRTERSVCRSGVPTPEGPSLRWSLWCSNTKRTMFGCRTAEGTVFCAVRTPEDSLCSPRPSEGSSLQHEKDCHCGVLPWLSLGQVLKLVGFSWDWLGLVALLTPFLKQRGLTVWTSLPASLPASPPLTRSKINTSSRNINGTSLVTKPKTFHESILKKAQRRRFLETLGHVQSCNCLFFLIRVVPVRAPETLIALRRWQHQQRSTKVLWRKHNILACFKPRTCPEL